MINSNTISTSNNRIYFQKISDLLIDPLAQELSKSLRWYPLEGFNSSELFPVVIIGRGKPIICLHGFDSSFLEFRRIVPLLSHRYKLIIPDLFGFGFCPRPKNTNYSPQKIIDHLSLLIEKLIPCQDFGLLGASMGGSAALCLAREYSKRVKKILLLSPAGLINKTKKIWYPFNEIGASFLGLKPVRAKLCRQAFANPDKTVGKPEDQIASIHLGVDGWRRSLASFALSGGFSSTAFPYPKSKTYIIFGDQDRIISDTEIKKIEALKQFNLEILSECGHLPHIDQSKIVSKRFINFF